MVVYQGQLVGQRLVRVPGDVQDVDLEDVRIIRVMKELITVHKE
jgi:hypothetical protein